MFEKAAAPPGEGLRPPGGGGRDRLGRQRSEVRGRPTEAKRRGWKWSGGGGGEEQDKLSTACLTSVQRAGLRGRPTPSHAVPRRPTPSRRSLDADLVLQAVGRRETEQFQSRTFVRTHKTPPDGSSRGHVRGRGGPSVEQLMGPRCCWEQVGRKLPRPSQLTRTSHIQQACAT